MARAEVGNDVIIVSTVWNEKELVKQIPGARWDTTNRHWFVPLTWTACVQLRGVFGDGLHLGPDIIQWATKERAIRIDPSMALREQRVLEELDGSHPNAYSFQRAGIAFMKSTIDGCILADEMGTGKTIQTLQTINLSNAALPALVICPNSTKTNWAKEVEKWFPEAHPYVVHGSQKVRRDIIAKSKTDPMAIVIINIEGLRGHSRLAPYGSVRLVRCSECSKTGTSPVTRCEVHPRDLNGYGFKTVVFDEAHRLKDPKAKQTRAAWAVAHDPSVTRRFALTGTPIANDPSDLWSIWHFIAPNEAPRRSAFIDRYCLQAWNQFGGLNVIGVRPETREEFHKIFDPRFRRMPKALVLDQLPPKVRTTRYVEMTPKQAKAYYEMEEGMITRLDNGEVLIATNSLTNSQRLLQLSSSYCEIDPDTNEVMLKEPSPKIDALLDIIAEAGDQQLAVCAQSRKLIELAAKRLTKHAIPHGLITGKVDAWDRQRALDNLSEGRIKVLLFTVQAGGTGLNMTAASTMVFLQRSWSMIDNKQAEDRAHRIGSEKHDSIQIIDLVTQGTVEEHQVIRLAEKMMRLEEVNRDRQRLVAAGKSTHELDRLETIIMESDLRRPA